jgi:predicted RND superfamily exporter protein
MSPRLPNFHRPIQTPIAPSSRLTLLANFWGELETISQPTYSDQLNAYYFMGVLILEVLLEIVQRDALLAIASFAFVFLYIRISVGSWFLAFVGLLEITLSIPISWFIFSFCFRIKYFSFLNALCLFIVADIGADDIFIFMDAYKQSAHNSEEPEILLSLESRMSWVYRRTGSAMLITSATTCAAFLCTLITPLAGVRAFGVFAATVILVDYILVMTMFCTAVVIYHNKFEDKICMAANGSTLIEAARSSEDYVGAKYGANQPTKHHS